MSTAARSSTMFGVQELPQKPSSQRSAMALFSRSFDIWNPLIGFRGERPFENPWLLRLQIALTALLSAPVLAIKFTKGLQLARETIVDLKARSGVSCVGSVLRRRQRACRCHRRKTRLLVS